MGDLPPGFHFYPSDEDLVVHFLHSKASTILPGHHDLVPTLLEPFDPWELNGRALQGGKHWYFFARPTQTRVTANGYWEAEAKDVDQSIKNVDNEEIGMKKTLVFYVCSGDSTAIRTSWVMHELYSLQCVGSGSSFGNRRTYPGKSGRGRKESETWVICRVYDASFDTQDHGFEDCVEMSCLDEEAYDDMDDLSWPN